jgi:hypothetical protein
VLLLQLPQLNLQLVHLPQLVHHLLLEPHLPPEHLQQLPQLPQLQLLLQFQHNHLYLNQLPHVVLKLPMLITLLLKGVKLEMVMIQKLLQLLLTQRQSQ